MTFKSIQWGHRPFKMSLRNEITKDNGPQHDSIGEVVADERSNTPIASVIISHIRNNANAGKKFAGNSIPPPDFIDLRFILKQLYFVGSLIKVKYFLSSESIEPVTGYLSSFPVGGDLQRQIHVALIHHGNLFYFGFKFCNPVIHLTRLANPGIKEPTQITSAFFFKRNPQVNRVDMRELLIMKVLPGHGFHLYRT